MTTRTVTRFCLVRHGETDWNIERRLQGQIDTQLNDTGRQQAEALGQALAGTDRQFAALYASDLQRTRQTADAIARHLHLDARPEPALRERHFGCFQGMTFPEAAQQMPENFRRFRSRDPAYVPDNGESLAMFQSRVRHFLEAAAARHPGQDVLIVSHGGVLDIAYRLARQMPLSHARDFPIPNAALNWISTRDGTWQLDSWADQSHLSCSLDEL